MGSREQVTGWRLDAGEREALLERIPPHYPDVFADHGTLRSGTDSETPLPQEKNGEIVGMIDDGEGLQALVMAIDGTTDRGDGSSYHITWSLDRSRDRHAVQSNEVIAVLGWQRLEPAIPITLKPGRWPRR